MIKSFYSFSISLFLAGALVGCGGSSGEAIDNSSDGKSPQKQKQHSKPAQKPKKKMIKGNFIDAPVWGLEYSCKGQTTETTDENGAFECASLPVTFRVGNVIIGTVADKMPIDNKVFPQDLVGVTRDKIDDANVKKLASFLQTLDDDGDIEGVIKIDENLKKELKSKKEVHLVNLDRTQLSKMLDKELVKLEDAIKHLKKNIFTDKKPDSIEIKLSKDTLPLGLDGEATLHGNYTFGDGELSSIIVKGVTYSSSDENIAMIDSDGGIITKKEGSVEIVASYGDLSSTTTLRVSGVALTNIEITKPTMAILTDLAIGRGTRLRVNGSYSNDNLKKDVTNQVIWSSKSPLFSGINPRGEYIRASGLGVGSITASLFDLSDTLEFDIKKSDIKKVKIYPREITVPLGKSISAAALGYYEDDSNTTYDESNRSIRNVAKWSVDDNKTLVYTEDGNLTPNYFYINTSNEYGHTSPINKVGVISSDGSFKYLKRRYEGLIGAKKGETYLRVDYKGIKDSIKVKVVDPEVEDIAISVDDNYLKVGDSTAYNILALYTDGNITTINDKVIVKSLNPAILEVKDGNITALDGGYGSIKVIYAAKDGNITNTIGFTTQKMAKPIELKIDINDDKEGSEVPVGSRKSLSLDIKYSDGDRDFRTPDINWSVDSSDIAKIDYNYGTDVDLQFLKKGEVTVTAKVGNLTASKKISVVGPSSIKIDFGESNELIEGENKSLSIKVKYSDGSERDYNGDDIFWEIDNANTALLNVSEYVNLNAIKGGDVTVTVKLGDLSTSQKFSILSPSSLSITYYDGNEIPLGEGKHLSLKLKYKNGREVEYNGFNAYWKVDNNDLVSLNPGHVSAVINAIKKGEVTVTAEVDGLSVTQKFKLIDPIFRSFEIASEGDNNVYIGKPKKFKLVARYSDGSRKDIEEGAEWSLASNIASVDNKGIVNATVEGSTLLRVRYDGKRTDQTIYVQKLKLNYIEGAGGYYNLNIGQTKTFEITGYYNDGTREKITQNLIWKSSDESVATVDENGKVTALKSGHVSISVEYNGDKDDGFMNMVMPFEINVQSNTTGATNSGVGA